MRLMRFLVLFLGFAVLICCRHKGTGGAGTGEKMDPEEFLGMFRSLTLPVNFADSSLLKKSGDSSIAGAVYSQFLPDSLIHKYFGKSVKPKLYASGKLIVKKAETYLFIKALTPAKKLLLVYCLNADGNFSAGMPLLIRDENNEYRYSATIDNKYAISVSRLRKDTDGKTFFVRTVYVYNAEGVFTLIMTESNEAKPKSAQIYNPIDTLARKHKFTGDYIQDKRNFISFRDGKTNSVIRFFVHFEKDNRKCKGELKGEARFINPNLARYAASGDPCSLEFSFTEKNVRMKELEGCGNHRDIRCYFEGLYVKHKEIPVKTPKVKKIK